MRVDIALEKVSASHKGPMLNYTWCMQSAARRLHPFTGDTFIQAIILSAAIYIERERLCGCASAGADFDGAPALENYNPLSRLASITLFGWKVRPAGKGKMPLHNYARHPTELCNCFGTFVARACLPSCTSGARTPPAPPARWINK